MKSTKAHLQPWQTSEMKRFAKIVNFLELLTVFVKRSILYV